MDTLQLLHSLKTEQENGKINTDISYISNSDYSDLSQSADEEEIHKVHKEEVSVKEEPAIIPKKENLPAMEGIAEEEVVEQKKPKPQKPTTGKPRKRRARISPQVNVYAKNTTKNNRSYADMDDEYSYLDADREEWLCPRRDNKKHKAKAKETILTDNTIMNSKQPIQNEVSQQNGNYLSVNLSLNEIPIDSYDTKVNEDDIIISHQFFTILMSLNNINDMKPFLNSKHIRYLRSPPSNSSILQNTQSTSTSSTIVQSTMNTQSTMQEASVVDIPSASSTKPVFIHLEPNNCPSVFSKFSSRNMVVKTNIGWSFLSHLVPDNGFDE